MPLFGRHRRLVGARRLDPGPPTACFSALPFTRRNAGSGPSQGAVSGSAAKRSNPRSSGGPLGPTAGMFLMGSRSSAARRAEAAASSSGTSGTVRIAAAVSIRFRHLCALHRAPGASSFRNAVIFACGRSVHTSDTHGTCLFLMEAMPVLRYCLLNSQNKRCNVAWNVEKLKSIFDEGEVEMRCLAMFSLVISSQAAVVVFPDLGKAGQLEKQVESRGAARAAKAGPCFHHQAEGNPKMAKRR